jgi:crossover junction endodeoxyribonuclease RuvC
MDRIILGIDPGTSLTGYGVILATGKSPVLLAMGIIDMSKMDDHYEKLHKIFDRTLFLIDEFKATELAMLKLGRAQGAAIAAALHRQLPINEYAPRKIKMAITGQGAASKEQVAFLLQRMLKFDEIPKNLDATDGLAAAVCHFFQNTYADGQKEKAKSWKEFASKNPDRINK